MKGPVKKADKIKSPKVEKASSGKKKTTWDPFLFGGAGATGEEAKSLERGPKSPKPGSAEGNALDDLQVRKIGIFCTGYGPDLLYSTFPLICFSNGVYF